MITLFSRLGLESIPELAALSANSKTLNSRSVSLSFSSFSSPGVLAPNSFMYSSAASLTLDQLAVCSSFANSVTASVLSAS